MRTSIESSAQIKGVRRREGGRNACKPEDVIGIGDEETQEVKFPIGVKFNQWEIGAFHGLI